MASRPVALGRLALAVGAALTSLEGVHLLEVLQDRRILTPSTDTGFTAESIPAGTWLAAMLVAALFLLVGLAAPCAAAVLVAGHLMLMLADLQLYSNHRLCLVLICTWFVFAGSDRALSVRARIGPPGDALAPWWPQLLVVATVSACYVFAGLSKANPEFLSGDLVAGLSPAWVPARLVAWATVPAEIAIGLGLWWRPVRRLALAAGVVLHLSIILLLGAPLVFSAFALLCLAAYPLAWTWSRPDQAEAAFTHRSSVA